MANYPGKAYDDWLQTNPAEEEAARYEMRLEAKTAEIRSELRLYDYADELSEALLIGVTVTQWLDEKAKELAINAIADEDENERLERI